MRVVNRVTLMDSFCCVGSLFGYCLLTLWREKDRSRLDETIHMQWRRNSFSVTPKKARWRTVAVVSSLAHDQHIAQMCPTCDNR